MTTKTETHQFEAEVQELLNLMIHSLYTEKEIFLRELISNASDAIDRLRMTALTTKDLLGEDEILKIRLEVDPEARTLSVIDNGIGMTREEMVENLGTIARSGSRAFLEQLKASKKGADGALIGQFGVGFYSAFMVADEVVVESLKAGETEGTRWRSTADGTYTIEDVELAERGTRVTLHLKPVLEGEDAGPDFTEPWVIERIVKRHSDFVEHAIEMDAQETEVEQDEDGKPKEGAEPKTVTITRTLNSKKPLWSRAKNEITDEEHAEFYRHISHDWNDPVKVLHVRAEVPVEFSALLYVPKEARPSFAEGPENKSAIALYARRVMIMADCPDLLPAWLRFVRGVVECADLPLNVSRQTLQANPLTQRILKVLTGKVLGALGDLLKQERAAYETFFLAHGRILKEGIYQGADDDNRISKICLFSSSGQEERTTLDEYVQRMGDDQDTIWYLTGMDPKTAASSPHLESFREKGIEVLLMADPVDEWMLQRLTEFGDKPLKAIDRGEVDLGSEDEKKTRKEQQERLGSLLEAMQKILDEDVSEVRFSPRLKDSAALLVSVEGAASPAMERVMREMHGEMPRTKRMLELNGEHDLVNLLERLHKEEDAAFEDYTRLLHGQALIAEGSPVSEPAAFADLVTRLMVKAGRAAQD